MKPDSRCFMAVTEWVPESAWVIAGSKTQHSMLAAFADRSRKLIPDGWLQDRFAHHGPIHPNVVGQMGVTMVLRAQRIAPTKSGTCDETCTECVARKT